ncbi:uncharacterized protein LOC112574839 [Pomacea canaliculata]|uniref:uncharacterized protein LOC112574839 n=1 Tax=Pomacea canaliculata TaxID=400727 RepID=UPI000D72AA9C|nr:uncharacterized protein LOC112574839 [Pomacea canaliculata]
MNQTPSSTDTDGGAPPKLSDAYVSLTEQQAAHLDTGKIQEETDADVDIDYHASPFSGAMSVIVRGNPPEIEAAASLIDQKTDDKANTARRQLFWLQWVEASFPDLDSRAYFLPPVYFNRVPMTKESVAGQDVLVLRSAPGQAGQSSQPVATPSTAGQTCLPQPRCVLDSDVRDDAAMQRLLFCLQNMTEQKGEVLVGLSFSSDSTWVNLVTLLLLHIYPVPPTFLHLCHGIGNKETLMCCLFTDITVLSFVR